MITSISELKTFILKALEDKKAKDIIVIDLENKTSIAQYMIFATGSSTKNVSAIADYLALEIKHHAKLKTTIEGLTTSEWVLIDVGDIIVNIFHPEARAHYRLEELWQGK